MWVVGEGGWETGCGTLTWIGSNVVSTWGFFVVGFVRCLFTHRGLSRSGETRPWRISFTRAVLFFSFLYRRGAGGGGGGAEVLEGAVLVLLRSPASFKV